MNEKDAIRVIMKERKVTQEVLSKRLGYANQSGIARILNRKGGVTLDTLIKFMNAMDYDVVLKDRIKNKDYVLDSKGDPEEEIKVLKSQLATIQARLGSLTGGEDE